MKLLTYPFLFLIRIWQKFIAPGLAPRCKYYPSCSHYTFDAIKRYNLLGLVMGAWRVIRCNPFSYGGVDYVPDEIKLGPIRLGAR
ncbi:MAG: membrane protein insertion efficiency factor YidD [Actinomycetota bacterium]|jgi:putative membrane protein insertion efficiency factor